ncbi:hypothetical protein K439DRAFT_1645454 [Ramaria rubella]|nr:hypothetical protein K439DRAFT_1645454 [Ramaria rubella]
MDPVRRKDAPRAPRPVVRYWKGKAPKGVVEAQDSDSDSDNAPQDVEPADVPIGDLDAGDNDDEEEEEEEDAVTRKKIQKTMNVALKDVDISKEGKVIVGGKEESGRTLVEQEEETSDEELPTVLQGEESGSSEYETDSEEEGAKAAAMFRPVFIPKRARETIAAREAEALESEEAIRKRELEAEERRKQSHDMVAESIKRELAEKETEEHIPDVDDTDGLDPTAEFEAWRLRELGRIKRDKEEAVRREEEREELERRRALPEEVRLKEDLERAQKTRDDKPKGQQKFLQKYWHKGAFHQDEEILRRHDFTEATESTIDVSLLPKVMQVKDFGKRSRTKYTHLLDQDTTIASGGFGGLGPAKPGAQQGCFACGGPHLKKDCPQLQNQGPMGSGANRTVFASGANGALRSSERQWGIRDECDGKSWRDMDEDQRDDRGKNYSTGLDRKRRSRSRSRSRSPSRPIGRRRSRSRSTDLDRKDRDKRRRSSHRRSARVPPMLTFCLLNYRLCIVEGLAGLTAAYLLSTRTDLKFEVHVFEKAPTLGMDTHSISVSMDEPEERRIDVPMRSFQGGYYKQLIALYHCLGVEFRRTDFSYSFSTVLRGVKATQSLWTYFIYNGSSGVKGVNLPANDPFGHLAQDFALKCTSFLYFALATLVLLGNYIRLVVLSAPFFRPQPSVTFEEWVSRTTPTGRLARWTRLDTSWSDFTHDIMLPLFSAVCTAPEGDVYSHPMAEFLEYIWLTFGSHHYVVKNGIRDVVSRLTVHVSHIHLSCTIISIDPDASDPSKLTIQTTDGTYSGFSHLIIATQANSSIPLLSLYRSSLPIDASEHRQAVEDLIDCLQTFKYRKTVVVNHTDEAFLPPDARDKRDLNLVMGMKQDPDEKDISTIILPSSYTMATHVLSRYKPIYQTTNPIIPPREGSILSIAILERAVVTAESKAALRQLSTTKESWWPFTAPSTSLGPLQGARRLQCPKRPGIWLCGSYAHRGIPLLEGCVASARNVVERGVLLCEGVEVHDAPW